MSDKLRRGKYLSAILICLVLVLSITVPIKAETQTGDAISISTVVLMPGAKGMGFTYSQTLASSGGSGSYTWTKTSGDLPSGLSLSSTGIISGTPSESGKFELTVKATDAENSSNSDTRELTLNIREAGYLSLWGDNASGQIGNDSTTDVKWPVQPENLVYNNIFTAAAGGLHTLAVTLKGEVYAWGENGAGQLGIGSTTDEYSPQKISNLKNILEVAGGSKHSLALNSNGDVYSWGNNSKGQIGINSTTTATSPVQVLCGEQKDGGSYLTNIVAIAAGSSHSLALKADGTVWAWGDNSKGQLGINSTTAKSSPVQILCGEQKYGGKYLTDIVAIAAGFNFNLALDSQGKIWAWGDDSKGQLGNGSNTNSKIPVEVDDVSDIIAIAAGSLHSLAIDSDGIMYAWGDNSNGQLGISSTENKNLPELVDAIEDATTVSAGCYHSLVVDKDGNIWVCGDNSAGQLGIGSTADKYFMKHADAFDNDALLTAANNYDTLAISRNRPGTESFSVSISTTALEKGKVDAYYSQTLEATGGSGDYTWSKISGSLPDGVALGKSSGIITGLPSSGGKYTFTVQATDAEDKSQYDTATLTITIKGLSDLSITTTSLAGGAVGVDYSQSIQATGGSKEYTWSTVYGSIPTGLSLGIDSGKIWGTPSEAGDFYFKVKVADDENDSMSDFASFTITISETNNPVKIITTSPYGGTVGVAYNQTFKASGGSGVYTWSQYSGTLPEGLILDSTAGKLSGTPTTAGSYTFALQAVDKSKSYLKDMVNYAIVIKPAPILTDIILSGLTSSSQIRVDSGGAVQESCQLTSTDGNLSLAILSSSKLVDSSGTPLASLTASKLNSFPDPPLNSLVITAYNFEPEGATFTLPITATLKYADSDIPSGNSEDSLYFAAYTDSQWKKMISSIDEDENTVSAKISHFSIYGLLLNISTSATASIAPTTTPAQPSSQTPISPAKSTHWWLIFGVVLAGIVVALLIVINRRKKYGNY